VQTPSIAAATLRLDRASSILAFWLGLGALGLGACLRFPGALTSPEVRDFLPLTLLRIAANGLVVAALGAGLFALRRGVTPRAVVGVVAALLGVAASSVPLHAAAAGQGLLGLDWLVADGLLVVLVLIPLEKAWPQRVFGARRPGLRTDVAHFVINHLAIHGIALLGLLVARSALSWTRPFALHAAMARLPLPLQILALLVAADLVQYWLHRAMHEVPWLWRVHAVHHSSQRMDSLAGSRIHFLETLMTRSSVYACAFGLGVSFPALLGFGALIAFQGTFIHANVRVRYGLLEHFIVSPRFHHFHHASDAEAIDTNYAGTFPWIDRLFGTHHLPENRYPLRYGTVKDDVPASSILGQQAFPFRRG
jgi:sterol desaturase/sphingolipid hydroxylase (fatty acid hydroxylase superfamily)